MFIFKAIIASLAAVILIGITEGAKDDYVRRHPGQPGWGMYVFGYGAIAVLLLI